MNTRPYTFDRVVRMLIAFSVIAVLFLLTKRLSDVLLPFLLAWLIAYLLQPIVHFFQVTMKIKKRLPAVLITLLLVNLIFAGLFFMLAPLISVEFQKLSQLIVAYTKNVNFNEYIPLSWQTEIRDYISNLNLQTVLSDENLMSGLRKVTPGLWSIVNGSVDLILGLAVGMIVLLYLVFILIDYEKIASGMYEIIPAKYKKIVMEIIEDLEQGMNRYFRGQALIALLVGILSAIGFSIVNLPLAIVLGMGIGVLTMVPYLKMLGLIPAVILALMQSVESGQSFPSVLLGVAIVFIVVQAIEDFFLVPKIMGEVTGLKPALILLSLSIWGSLLGIAGMIIALPLTTLLISYYKRFVLREEELLHDSEPLSENSTETTPENQSIEM